jgi:Uma2 family endonuclease
MAADPAKKRATYADLEAVPPHLMAEIIFGSLVTHPRPAPPHTTASFALGSRIGPKFQDGEGGPGGWIFANEPELHLGENVVVPDIAGWKRERYATVKDRTWISVVPDWICEILSPSTENYDRNEKRKIYATAGVGHIWLLDPRSLSLECFQNVAGNWLLMQTFTDDETVSAPPFEAAQFKLKSLFPAHSTGTHSE